MFPKQLKDHLSRVYQLKISSVEQIRGGSIHHAARIETNNGVFFLKWNSAAQPEMFACEADGLARICQTQTVRVPIVLGYHDAGMEDIPGFILMEWIRSIPFTAAAMRHLGVKLAELHQAETSGAPYYGLALDNYIGSTHQINSSASNWLTFFRNSRIGYQIDLAQRNGLLPITRRQQLDFVLEHMDRWLPESTPVSLLHGDLWSGNILLAPNGEPVLIDPAVYNGSHEADIAFTELFGGFSPQFYAGYQEVISLQPGYIKRRDLYNLYHLLNHLNIFGETYGEAVDQTLMQITR